MSPSQSYHTNPGSDEFLYRLLNSSSLWGNNQEAMMLQEALATTTKPLEKEKSNSNRIIIRLEILASLIFFAVVFITQLVNNSNVVSDPVEPKLVEQQKLIAY